MVWVSYCWPNKLPRTVFPGGSNFHRVFFHSRGSDQSRKCASVSETGSRSQQFASQSSSKFCTNAGSLCSLLSCFPHVSNLLWAYSEDHSRPSCDVVVWHRKFGSYPRVPRFFWGGAPNSGHSFLNLTHHRTCRQRVVESSVRRSTVEITTKKYEQNIKVGHACALAAIILCLWECLSWRSHWGSSPSSPNERRTTASVCRPSDRIKRLGPLVHQYAACYRLHPYAAWKLIVVLLAHRW